MAIFDKQWWTEVLDLHESPPIEFETDDYENYVNQNRDRIEKAAAVFNLPIQDMMLAFVGGQEVVLSDDMWSKLENSKSYKIKSLDDAIQVSLKAGVDPKSYIDFIKDGKELPLPMVLCYGQDKYYLVGGDIILSLYRALGSIPTVLQGTLNLQTRSQHEPLEEEAGQSIKDKHADIVKYFVKFAAKELGLKQLPAKVTISYDTDAAKNQHSFGHFDPSNDKIWVYVKDRNTADFLRTLAHELVHRKQAEDGRLEMDSGKTGSEIENEANAQAGVLLRKFGKEHEDIYETLNESIVNEYNFGLDQAFEWSYKGGPAQKYTFTTGQTKYEVIFRPDPEIEGGYERTYKPVGSVANTKTGEGKPLPVIATVTAITLDFMERNNNWNTIIIRPISDNRYRAVIKFLDENIPTDQYNIEEIDGAINITRKLNEITVNNPGNFKFEIGDKVADYDNDTGEIIDRTTNIQDEYDNYTHPEGMVWHDSPFTTANLSIIENPYYLVRYDYDPEHNSDYWRPEKDLTKI
jgi:hypothetical protein